MSENGKRAVIVIPVLNEAGHIGRLIDSLLAETCDIPIRVYDGGSSDVTRDIVARRVVGNQRLRLIANPGRTQAFAVNLAAGQAARAGAQVLIRMDAHAEYPPGFAVALCHTLDETGADSVVVPLKAVGQGRWSRAAAALQNGWLGNGGAAHRTGRVRGWVAHGHHAAFRLDSFRRLGGYDTRFRANEDAEYDRRLTEAGGRIFLENRLSVAYHPRPNPLALARQMFRNGFYRLLNARKHRRALGLRQQLPVLATVLLALSPIMAAALGPVALVPGGAYLGAVGLLALATARGQPVLAGGIAALAVISHAGFGFGVLAAALSRAGAFLPAMRTRRRVA